MSGLRERKKEQTRAAIQRAALRLIAEGGYAATTCEQIAAAAEVSPATLFRYFPTKEDIVLQDGYDPVIAAAVVARPPGESPVVAVRRGFAEALAEVYSGDVEAIRQRTALILSVPALRSRAREQYASLVTHLQRALAQRSGGDTDALAIEVTAAACAAAVSVAVERWATRGGDLPASVDDAFAALGDLSGERKPVTGPAVSVSGVTKQYGTLAAVDGVTLEVGAGEVYALLGLNGAGKTTLIRMLLGMVRPTAGSLGLVGRPVTDRSVWAEVGYLVETPSAYPDLTVRENLDVARRLRRLPSRGVVDDAVDRFGLGPYATSKARTLSLGNAQRLGLAKALLHQPRILVLDEPVNGLDPAGVVEVRTMLTDLARDDGVTVLLSSHLLGEVARVATRIGILHHGRLIEELDSTTLEASTRTRLEVGSRNLSRAAQILQAAGFSVQQSAVDTLVLEGRAVLHPEEVATALVEGGEPPTRLAVVDEDLEGHFMRLVGHHADATTGGTR